MAVAMLAVPTAEAVVRVVAAAATTEAVMVAETAGAVVVVLPGTRGAGLAARRGQPRRALRADLPRRTQRRGRRGQSPTRHTERPLGLEAWRLTSDVLASSSSDDQLRSRLDAVTRRLSGLGTRLVD